MVKKIIIIKYSYHGVIGLAIRISRSTWRTVHQSKSCLLPKGYWRWGTCIIQSGGHIYQTYCVFLLHLWTKLRFPKTFHPLPLFRSGGSEDGEQWAHQPEGGRTGWLSGAIQDQKAHSSQQTDESLLWTAGESATQLLLLKKSDLYFHCYAGSLSRLLSEVNRP